MYPGTGTVYLELLCGCMDTFTIMVMCIHRNSTIKYDENKITGVQNETILKCRQKYRICGYMNMIIGYIDGYIHRTLSGSMESQGYPWNCLDTLMDNNLFNKFQMRIS